MRNTITITIECGDDATAGDDLAEGVCWVLDQIKDKLEDKTRNEIAEMASFPLHDINGVKVGACDLDIEEDWAEAEAYCSTIARDHCVEILEGVCCVQCRDDDSVADLRETVFENIKSGDVTLEDVKSHCGD